MTGLVACLDSIWFEDISHTLRYWHKCNVIKTRVSQWLTPLMLAPKAWVKGWLVQHLEVYNNLCQMNKRTLADNNQHYSSLLQLFYFRRGQLHTWERVDIKRFTSRGSNPESKIISFIFFTHFIFVCMTRRWNCREKLPTTVIYLFISPIYVLAYFYSCDNFLYFVENFLPLSVVYRRQWREISLMEPESPK